MAGYGDLAEGLANGYMKGMGLKRQEKLDQQADEDRQLRISRDTEDRNYTLQQRGREDAEYKRNQKQIAFQDAHKEAGRKISPFIVAGNPLGALDVIEDEFNNNPAFDDGELISVTRGEDGKPILDKDGKVTLTVTGKADGKAIGTSQVDPREAVGWFMHIENPWAKVQADQATAAKEAQRQKERKEALDDKKVIIREEADAKIRTSKALGGVSGKGAPKQQQLFTFYKSIFPDKSDDELVRLANSGAQKDPASMIADLTRAHMNANGTTLLESKAAVREAFPELFVGFTPGVTKPAPAQGGKPGAAAASKGVDDVATAFGF